tara:strand:- start:1334 stop:1546 length:213 start_codon:yes stop_codon:yes gene_type:complete
MKVRIWSKKHTQEMLKQLRKDGFEVNKKHEGFYEAFDGKIKIFSCMVGQADYICRLNPNYFDTESWVGDH